MCAALCAFEIWSSCAYRLEFEIVYGGLKRACEAGATLDPPVNAKMILSFLRDRSATEANQMLQMAESVLSEGMIIAVGMDNRCVPYATGRCSLLLVCLVNQLSLTLVLVFL